MDATNLRLDVKRHELDMARVDRTRILKQSHYAFVYGLIKSFTYFFKQEVVNAF